MTKNDAIPFQPLKVFYDSIVITMEQMAANKDIIIEDHNKRPILKDGRYVVLACAVRKMFFPLEAIIKLLYCCILHNTELRNSAKDTTVCLQAMKREIKAYSLIKAINEYDFSGSKTTEFTVDDNSKDPTKAQVKLGCKYIDKYFLSDLIEDGSQLLFKNIDLRGKYISQESADGLRDASMGYVMISQLRGLKLKAAKEFVKKETGIDDIGTIEMLFNIFAIDKEAV